MRQKGFTLIEILVALAVFGILIGIALPNFRTWIQSTQIRTAAESVLNGLQLARAEATRMNTTVSFTVTGNNWSVDALPVGGPTSAFYSPPANVQKRNSAEGSARTVFTATQNSVVFNGMGRVVPVPPSSVVFSVTNPAGGSCAPAGPMRCLNITVDAGGKTLLCDPALNGKGDPQACVP